MKIGLMAILSERKQVIQQSECWGKEALAIRVWLILIEWQNGYNKGIGGAFVENGTANYVMNCNNKYNCD